MDESSETSSAKDVPAGSLRTALNDLKRLIQSIVDGVEPTVRAGCGLWAACGQCAGELDADGTVSPQVENHEHHGIILFTVVCTREQWASYPGKLPSCSSVVVLIA